MIRFIKIFSLIFMAVVTWGMLEKSQIDPQKIEERIIELIAEHNDDEAAHIGEGRSLDQHKLSDVIDHLVASIVSDKIKKGEISGIHLTCSPLIIYTIFESLDGWDIDKDPGCWVDYNLGGAGLWFGGEEQYIGNKIEMFNIPAYPMRGVDFSKNPIFETTGQAFGGAGLLVYFGIGEWETYFVGFKIVGDNLYAVHQQNGVEYATQIPGVDVEGTHKYRIEYTSGQKIEFFVDDVLKVTHTEDLTTGSFDQFFYLYLTSSTKYEKFFSMYYLYGCRES